MAFQDSFIVGDQQKTFGFTVKSRATEEIVDLTGATNAVMYCRKLGSPVLIEITPTLGDDLGTVVIIPGDEATLEPAIGHTVKYEAAWAEFDLAGSHFVVPDDGPDSFDLSKLR
jgi:hypothetical protein